MRNKEKVWQRLVTAHNKVLSFYRINGMTSNTAGRDYSSHSPSSCLPPSGPFSLYCFMTLLLSSCQCFFPFCLPCPSPAESDLSETGRCAHLLPASGSHVWESDPGKTPTGLTGLAWAPSVFLQSQWAPTCADVHISYLPLAHMFERMVQVRPWLQGGTICVQT